MTIVYLLFFFCSAVQATDPESQIKYSKSINQDKSLLIEDTNDNHHSVSFNESTRSKEFEKNPVPSKKRCCSWFSNLCKKNPPLNADNSKVSNTNHSLNISQKDNELIAESLLLKDEKTDQEKNKKGFWQRLFSKNEDEREEKDFWEDVNDRIKDNAKDKVKDKIKENLRNKQMKKNQQAIAPKAAIHQAVVQNVEVHKVAVPKAQKAIAQKVGPQVPKAVAHKAVLKNTINAGNGKKLLKAAKFAGKLRGRH